MTCVVHRVLLACLVVVSVSAGTARGQNEAPPYDELRLESVFPAGGRVGTTVDVEFRTTRADLFAPRSLVIDGPSGISFRDLRTEKDVIRATLEIAADAVPGRREVRLLGERVGLTNMVYFSVGSLPELVEDPDRETLPVTLPCVVNGRIHPNTDSDRYEFTARAGQALALVARAQAIDSHGQAKNYGFVDLDLRVLDASGRVVAESRDSLGLDPLIELRVPSDGTYTAVVEHVLYRGYPQAVYRLVLSDVPLPIGLFPPGVRRGETTSARLFGPLTDGDALVTLDGSLSPLPWAWTGHPLSLGGVDIPYVIGDGPELVETEPNDDLSTAVPLALGATVNARFERPGDSDWFRIDATEPGPIEVTTLAHRWLRSPVDTTIEIQDAAGKRLATNDDGFPIEYMSLHDIEPPDSRAVFRVDQPGPVFVRVFDEAGTSGERAVYRLSARPARPGFQLHVYPDGVPVWGPGTTSAVVVKVLRELDLDEDIELTIEGLPEGWRGSRAMNITSRKDRPTSSFYKHFGSRTFLTITAPEGAKPGDLAEFRIVGRCVSNGMSLERTARPLTWYYTSDIGFFRESRMLRVAVTAPRGTSLDTGVVELTGTAGETLSLPFQVRFAPADQTSIVVVANLATAGVACAYNPPQKIDLVDGRGTYALKVTDETPPGEFYLTLSRSWASDIRIGMPAPCTPLIRLVVKPK